MDNSTAILLAIAAFVFSALFSGLETGIYRLSRLRLRLAAETGGLRHAMLSRAMRDGPGLLLALLVANNLANYLATSCITFLFLSAVDSEHAAELFATLATAPLLFVFGESIPKNLFLYRADLLTAWLAPLLFVTHRVLTWCGAVPLLRLASQAFARMTGAPVSSHKTIASAQSHQVRAILRDTHEEGLLSPVQSDIIDRIVNIPGLHLGAVMVPLARVQSVDIRSDRAALLNKLKRHAFTRLPVWAETPGHIVGFIDIYDVLSLDDDLEDVEPFVKPIRRLDVETPVIDAIDIMRREELKIVLVTRSRRAGHDTPAGIVTMKDLVEELLGELAEW
jgi:CBS domain containing-hemolysin-like protein